MKLVEGQTADQPALPETIEEVDALKLQVIFLKIQNARAQSEALERERISLEQLLMARYKLGPQDAFDANTLKIVRRE